MPHDGTQDPGPPPLMADPLSGLVTGGRDDSEPPPVRVVQPVLPDISAVQEAMRAVLDDDDLAALESAPTKDSPTGEIPAQATAPAAEQTPPAPAAPPAAPAETPAEKTLPRIPAATAPAPPAVSNAEPKKKSGFNPGPAAIVALLLVIAVLAVILVISLVDTISSLFS